MSRRDTGPIQYGVVSVHRVLRNFDCRRVRALQAKARRKNFLGPEQVIIAFNRRCTMARAVDRNGTFITFYADKGFRFDPKRLVNGQELNLSIRLVDGSGKSYSHLKRAA